MNHIILNGLSYKCICNVKEKYEKEPLIVDNEPEKKQTDQNSNVQNLKEKQKKLILTSNLPSKRLIIYSNTTKFFIKHIKHTKK